MRSVPNLISIFRICLVPVFIALYVLDGHETKIFAAIIYVIAAISDFLDGFIARKYNASSNLGKVLDPLGDKLMTITVMVCITVDGLIPLWAVVAAVCKELLMAIGGLIVHKKAGVEIPPSNIMGKTSTVVFFIVCAALILFRKIPSNAANAMISLAIGLMLVALGSYVNTFIVVMKNEQK